MAGNGAFDYNTLMDMPIYMRQYWFSLMIERLEAEREAITKTQQKTKKPIYSPSTAPKQR